MHSVADDRSVVRPSVDVFASLYRCRRKLSSARSQGTWEWKLECSTSAPLHIVLHVEKSAMVSPNLRVTCNRNTIFPQCWTGDSSIRKPGKLLRDFQYSWSLRGTVVGMKIERAIEIRPLRNGREQWLVGTLLNHHLDGSFDVLVQTYDQFGEPQEELHSSVSALDLRYADSKRPLQVPEHKICLFVPYNNPVEDAYLSINGTKFHLSFLAKPSPPQSFEDSPHIIIQVPRHSDRVTANVGRSALLNYSRCNVRGVTNKCALVGFGSSSWIIQIGHAQHRIDVSRKSNSSKDITLEVDGEVLVEASKTELGCVKENWECSFRFFGEQSLSFHLVHTSAAGNVVGHPHIIQQRCPFEHICKVEVHDLSDLSNSTLYVDGVVFRSLPALERVSSEPRTHLSLQDLRSQYNITVPDEVSQFAEPREVVAENNKVLRDLPATTKQPLASCYCCDNAQPTLDISRSFNSLLTTLNWEGSRIVAPVSGRHPPASMPCSREGSVPRSLATSPRLEDSSDAITPREVTPAITPGFLVQYLMPFSREGSVPRSRPTSQQMEDGSDAITPREVAPAITPDTSEDDVLAIKPRKASEFKMPLVPRIDWRAEPKIVTPTTPISPLAMSQICLTPLTTMNQPSQHEVSQMSKIHEEHCTKDEERHEVYHRPSGYFDALPFSGDYWPNHWGALPTPLSSSRMEHIGNLRYMQKPGKPKRNSGTKHQFSFLRSGTPDSSSFSHDEHIGNLQYMQKPGKPKRNSGTKSQCSFLRSGTPDSSSLSHDKINEKNVDPVFPARFR